MPAHLPSLKIRQGGKVGLDTAPQFQDHLPLRWYRFFHLRSKIRQSRRHKSASYPISRLWDCTGRVLVPSIATKNSTARAALSSGIGNIIRKPQSSASQQPFFFLHDLAYQAEFELARQFHFRQATLERRTSNPHFPIGYHQGTSYNVIQPAIAQRESKTRLGNSVFQGL